MHELKTRFLFWFNTLILRRKFACFCDLSGELYYEDQLRKPDGSMGYCEICHHWENVTMKEPS
jgi:hypothetical protein